MSLSCSGSGKLSFVDLFFFFFFFFFLCSVIDEMKKARKKLPLFSLDKKKIDYFPVFYPILFDEVRGCQKKLKKRKFVLGCWRALAVIYLVKKKPKNKQNENRTCIFLGRDGVIQKGGLP